MNELRRVTMLAIPAGASQEYRSTQLPQNQLRFGESLVIFVKQSIFKRSVILYNATFYVILCRNTPL